MHRETKECHGKAQYAFWVGTMSALLVVQWRVLMCLLSGHDECTVSSAMASSDVPLEWAR